MLFVNRAVQYQYILWFYGMGALAAAGLYVAGHVVGVHAVQGYWLVCSPFVAGLPYIYGLVRKQRKLDAADAAKVKKDD